MTDKEQIVGELTATPVMYHVSVSVLGPCVVIRGWKGDEDWPGEIIAVLFKDAALELGKLLRELGPLITAIEAEMPAENKMELEYKTINIPAN